MKNKVDVVVGLCFGDEAKGRVIDNISNNYNIVARASGGSNAGHTLLVDGKKYVFRLLPSGILNESITSYLGGAMVINPDILEKELEPFPNAKVLVSENAHLVLPHHIFVDIEKEKTQNIGTTKNGIGPAYECKTARIGLQVKDLYKDNAISIVNKQLEYAARYGVTQTSYSTQLDSYGLLLDRYKRIFEKLVTPESFIRDQLSLGSRVLAECAQGTFLDIDHGESPYVTSSATTTTGVCTGLAISPKDIGNVTGVTKAYLTRVGNGFMQTELLDNVGEYIAKKGNEFGAVTGRPRRVGWLDIQQLRKSVALNGADELFLSKLDVLSGLNKVKVLNGEYIEFPGWQNDISNCTSFSQLPQEAKNYITYIQNAVGIPVTNISVSPDRNNTFKVLI